MICVLVRMILPGSWCAETWWLGNGTSYPCCYCWAHTSPQAEHAKKTHMHTTLAAGTFDSLVCGISVVEDCKWKIDNRLSFIYMYSLQDARKYCLLSRLGRCYAVCRPFCSWHYTGILDHHSSEARVCIRSMWMKLSYSRQGRDYVNFHAYMHSHLGRKDSDITSWA